MKNKYDKAYEYLEQYAKDNKMEHYEIAEDSYEYEDGLILIGYDDVEHKHENFHLCIDVSTM